MIRVSRLTLGIGLTVAIATPVAAQLTVIDPSNIAQAVLIADRTLRQFTTITDQLQLLDVMNAKLPGGLEKYRIPPVVFASHPTLNHPLLQALVMGDARGDLYRKAVEPVPTLQALETLAPDAQANLRSQLAHLEISDAIAERAIHQTAMVNQYASGELERAISAFEDDSVNPRTAMHYLTAILGKITGAQMIGRRQDTAINQELSHALELLILTSKQRRDTDAAVLALRLTTLRGQPISIVEGSATALTNWRQP